MCFISPMCDQNRTHILKNSLKGNSFLPELFHRFESITEMLGFYYRYREKVKFIFLVCMFSSASRWLRWLICRVRACSCNSNWDPKHSDWALSKPNHSSLWCQQNDWYLLLVPPSSCLDNHDILCRIGCCACVQYGRQHVCVIDKK